MRKDIKKVEQIDERIEKKKDRLKASDIKKLQSAKEKAIKGFQNGTKAKKEPVDIQIEHDIPEDDDMDIEEPPVKNGNADKKKKEKVKKTKPLSENRLKAYGISKDE